MIGKIISNIGHMPVKSFFMTVASNYRSVSGKSIVVGRRKSYEGFR